MNNTQENGQMKITAKIVSPDAISGKMSGRIMNIGKDGTTFFPHVSDDGVLSWTNDGERPNPEPMNISGPVGETGLQGLPGKDGTSVTVSNVSESTADGGSNVVTFSDGKTLTVKNGSKGGEGDRGTSFLWVTSVVDSVTSSDGERYYSKLISEILSESGADEVLIGDIVVQNNKCYRVFEYTNSQRVDMYYVGDIKGSDGKDGKSITITETTQSDVDGGLNTVTFNDGTRLSVRNGSKGSTGAAGVSVTVSKVTTSAADGGSNVVNFSDGKTLTVKNGSKGKDGTGVTVTKVTTSTSDGGFNYVNFSDGTNLTVRNGTKGSTGAAGVSVTVSNVSESAESGGSNVVTFSDGKKMTIKNGSRGSDGSDGKDGTSVTVANVTTSAADGGSNVVTFSDGKTLTVKNGSRGSDGSDGKDGTSVTVANVTTSSESGGSNVVTFSDGKTLTVKNGSKGDTGDTGPRGSSGDTGERGFGMLPIKSSPTTVTDSNGVKWRTVNESAVLSEANADKVIPGDSIVVGGLVFSVHHVSDGVVYMPIENTQNLIGPKGTNGTPATHSWDGTTLSVTSASGTSSANLKGDKGDTGAAGKDGASVSITSVKESSESGGSNVVTFSDGKTLTVKNGSKGSAGAAGKDGTSVSITSVKESSESGGSNVVTFSDGKTLTVKNGKDGAGGGSGGSSAPADWSVNDPNAPGYVKNRTHWMDDPVEVTVLSEQTAIIDEEMMAFLSPETGMEIGAEYTMTIDGTAFLCTAYELEGMVYIGNAAFVGLGNDTGEPFFAAYSAEESVLLLVLPAPGEHTVSLSGVFTQYHPLDSKFLPPTVGSFGEGNGAEVFNTVMNIAAGSYSHAEGRQTAAYGDGSHAEGIATVAQNDCAHAEGYSTLAFGLYSHAEGQETVSNAFGSHSEGIGTKALCNAQHVEGKWNQLDYQGQYAHILGGGQAEGLRANIHTVDWNGNAWFAGNIHPLSGLILSSPNTTRYRVMVSDTGELYTEKITG